MAAGMAHVVEHLAFDYRNKIEQTLGVPLPPVGEPLPPEVEYQLSGLVSQAAQELFNRNSAEAQATENEAKQEDPVFIAQMEELRIKALEAETRSTKVSNDTQVKIAELVQNNELTTDKLEQDLAIATERIRAQLLGDMLEAASRTEVIEGNERMKVAEFIMDQIRQEEDGVRDELQKKANKGESDTKLLVSMMNKFAEESKSTTEE
jgi:hypothetical protein